jgi:hypothetical protein
MHFFSNKLVHLPSDSNTDTLNHNDGKQQIMKKLREVYLYLIRLVSRIQHK